MLVINKLSTIKAVYLFVIAISNTLTKYFCSMNITSLIGITAAVLTTSAFVPQAVKIIRDKQVKSLSLTMYVMMFSGQFCWLVYGYNLNDLPLIFANIVGCTFSGTILGFKLFLKN